MKKKLLIALIFGSLGITTEVFFTAFSKLIQDFYMGNDLDLSLKGESYVWMFFIYCLIAPLFDLGYPKIKNLNILIRMLIYGAIILSVEFIMGFILDMIVGKCPWEYTSGITFFGYIRLDYIFFWMIFGFIIEKVYIVLNKRITLN